MRDNKLLNIKLENGRFVDGPYASTPDDFPNGAYNIMGPCGARLLIMAHDGTDPEISEGWEHVSVSTPKRPPNWEEMCFVKKMFWREDECVIQFHPAEKDYVNHHPYCLHMWRSTLKDFPVPPSNLVGPKKNGV